MTTALGILTAKKPIVAVLIAALAVLAIVVPAQVLAHTPEEGHSTSTVVVCDDDELLYGETIQCLVTVTDLTAAEVDAASPAGSVAIESDRDGSLGSCDLATATAIQATCTIADVTGSPGAHALTVAYVPQDTALHTFAASEATAALTVIGGTIVIEKETLGATGSFDFVLTEGDTDTAFSLETTATGAAGADSRTFADLVPSTFTVTEAAAAGWSLTALNCSIEAEGTTQSGTVASVAEREAVITLAAGETVTCRFDNTRHGAINIIKSSGDTDGTFAFTTTGGLAGGGFTLTTADGTGNLVASDLSAGSYSVTEADVEGWELTGIECTATTGSSTATSDGTVTIQLAANGTVTCIFANEAIEDDEPVVEVCEGPAAPAIAAAYLKAEGIKPGGPGRMNLIAAVATQLGGPHATFDGLAKCDDGYAGAVEAFLAGQVEAQDLGASVEAEAESESEFEAEDERGRGGPPAWVPRGGPPAWAPAGR